MNTSTTQKTVVINGETYLDLREPAVRNSTKRKVSRYSSESERYLAAAKLRATHKKMTLVECIRETGVCIPDFVKLCKTVSWPKRENWSVEFAQNSDVEKLLLLAEMSKDQ